MSFTSALHSRTSRRASFFAFVAAGMMALGLAAASLAAPASAYAYDQKPDGAIGTVGCPNGNYPRTYYVHSAKDAYNCIADMVSSRNNPMQESKITIEVTADWYTKYDGYLEIPSGCEVTLNLNGHMINRGKARSFGSSSPWWGEGGCEAIIVRKNATLTVNGGNTELAKSIEHRGTLDDVKDNGAAFWHLDANGTTVIEGGLITGGACDDKESGGGITVQDDASLYLNDVTIAGNITDKASHKSAACGAGVYLYHAKNAVFNNTRVMYNHAERTGGGVYIGSTCTVLFKGGSKVSCNLAVEGGGGIGITTSASPTVKLEESSEISQNYTLADGGGVYVSDYSGSTFSSDDGTGVIKNNYAEGEGGGAKIDSKYRVTLRNISVEGNTAQGDGGGIWQNGDCFDKVTVTDNSAKGSGGGIYWAETIKIKDSNVTGNTAAGQGGGIYCGNSSFYTNNFLGKVVVDENKLENGTCSNLHLAGKQDLNSAEGDDQLTGESRIGISASSWEGNRRKVGGNQAFCGKFEDSFEDVIYADDDKNYIELDDHYLYLVKKIIITSYQLSIYADDGETVLKQEDCTIDKAVTVASADYLNAFGIAPDYWLVEGVEGVDKIYPSDGCATFVMPANTVKLTAHYPYIVKKATLKLDVPKAGKTLPTTARLSWEGRDGQQGCDVAVSWSKLDADGNGAVAAGKAEAGMRYIAFITATRDCVYGTLFDTGISASDITVRAGTSSALAASASVNKATGALTVATAAFKTEGEAEEEPAETGTATIELENGGLAAGTGAGGSGVSLMAVGDSDLIDTATVSYSADSGTVTIAAPACEGFNFCYWSNVPDGVDADSEAGTAAFDAGDFKAALKLGAVYTPVVTSVELGMDAPAAGKKLSAELTRFVASCSDGEEVDLLEGFTGGNPLPIAWGPAAAGAKAQPYAGYVASVELADDEGYVDVEKVMSPNVAVSCNGKPAEGAVASFSVEGGKLCASAVFPADLASSNAAADKAAAKAAKGKTAAVRANAKTGKTKKAKAVKLALASSQSGAKAKVKVLSKSAKVKVNVKTGKVKLKKGAKKGKAYAAKLRVSYGDASKTVKVKFKVK